MNKNHPSKVANFYRVVFLLVFLLGGFFGLGQATKVYAADPSQVKVLAENTQPGGQPGDVQPGAQPSSEINCATLSQDDPRYANNCIYNPLPESALTDMLLVLMKGFLGIVAIWAVVFIVIGGFRMVMSQGNEEAYTTAKKTITWAIMGLVVALLSFAIIAMVQNFLGTDIKPVSTESPIVQQNGN